MWRFSKRKPFFSQEENDRIVHAIRQAEMRTSGEIRLFVENRCTYVDAIDRAKEIFFNLKMEKTDNRNGVLFYLAIKDRQCALFADTGIHASTGTAYWNKVVSNLITTLRTGDLVPGVISTILSIGDALNTHFPYDGLTDKNELPDEIVFGR